MASIPARPSCAHQQQLIVDVRESGHHHVYAAMCMSCMCMYLCLYVQVRSGLRHGGFVRAVEAWWGPVAGAEPLPDNYDGPLRAVKLTFSDKSAPVVSLRPCLHCSSAHAAGCTAA